MADHFARIEALESRQLFFAAGSISGNAFVDVNANGVRNVHENPPPLTRIYVDLNNNGKFDFGEPASNKSTNGRYHIEGIEHGTYRVRFETLLGYESSQADGYNVTVHAHETSHRTFPVLQPGIIQGQVFVDTNRNGVHDPGEPLIAVAEIVYLDTDHNEMFSGIGEPFTNPTANERYSFLDVPAGDYTIRIVLRGQTFTTPRAFTTTVRPGKSVSKDFGIAP